WHTRSVPGIISKSTHGIDTSNSEEYATPMMKTAPEVALTTAGAWTRPTEARRAAKLIMASGRASGKDPSHGLPPVPNCRRAEVGPRPERSPALPLPPLPQDVLRAPAPAPGCHAPAGREGPAHPSVALRRLCRARDREGDGGRQARHPAPARPG